MTTPRRKRLLTLTISALAASITVSVLVSLILLPIQTVIPSIALIFSIISLISVIVVHRFNIVQQNQIQDAITKTLKVAEGLQERNGQLRALLELTEHHTHKWIRAYTEAMTYSNELFRVVGTDAIKAHAANIPKMDKYHMDFLGTSQAHFAYLAVWRFLVTHQQANDSVKEIRAVHTLPPEWWLTETGIAAIDLQGDYVAKGGKITRIFLGPESLTHLKPNHRVFNVLRMMKDKGIDVYYLPLSLLSTDPDFYLLDYMWAVDPGSIFRFSNDAGTAKAMIFHRAARGFDRIASNWRTLNRLIDHMNIEQVKIP